MTGLNASRYYQQICKCYHMLHTAMTFMLLRHIWASLTGLIGFELKHSQDTAETRAHSPGRKVLCKQAWCSTRNCQLSELHKPGCSTPLTLLMSACVITTCCPRLTCISMLEETFVCMTACSTERAIARVVWNGLFHFVWVACVASAMALQKNTPEVIGKQGIGDCGKLLQRGHSRLTA